MQRRAAVRATQPRHAGAGARRQGLCVCVTWQVRSRTSTYRYASARSTQSLSEQEQKLYRLYGKLPTRKDLLSNKLKVRPRLAHAGTQVL